ncbi:MAG TPA: UvrD-helicase domain-containing protein [Thermoleophilaceae bacterium]
MTGRAGAPDTDADVEIRALLDETPRRAFVVIAGAGSGKTTSLVKALAHVARRDGPALRNRGQKVACITYTEIAASEIAEDVGAGPLVHVSTIHSFLWTLVRPFQKEVIAWVADKIDRKIAEAEAKLQSERARESTKERAGTDVERYTRHKEALLNVEQFRYGIGADYGGGVLGHGDILQLVPTMMVERPLFARTVAARFPYVFVDESQDTTSAVVDGLKAVAKAADGKMSLGFFGDPMQRIYPEGIGDIELDNGWARVEKPENFRSSERVLRVVNAVRADADGLQQVSGLPQEQRRKGEAWFFVLPADDHRQGSLARATEWLTKNSNAGDWSAESARGAKVLMILHEMAARRLGFHSLWAAFHQAGPGSSLDRAFDEGAAWPLRPFQQAILPIVSQVESGGHTVAAIRAHAPGLSEEALAETDPRHALSAIRDGISALRELMETGGPGSVAQALRVAAESGLVDLDPRLSAHLELPGGPGAGGEIEEADQPVLDAFMQCDVRQLDAYFDYVATRTPFSTQHGTKGAEYDRVLLVLDDDEGSKFTLYSYEKLLGLKPLSSADQKNHNEGKDSVIERTRRLLYVSVSRAKEALAVVLFASDVDAAAEALERSGLPGDAQVLKLPDIS